jgi:hypothetical protein
MIYIFIFLLVFSGYSVPAAQNKSECGIWVRGEHFKELDFQTLAGYGITHIFVNEAAMTRGHIDESGFKQRVAEAKTQGVKIHIWFQCFRPGNWVLPVIPETGQFNQEYFDEQIERAKKYVGFGDIAGIHLDYIRFSGVASADRAAYQHVYSDEVTGENAIAEFCRQISTAVKAIDPNVKLSAALMNERSGNARYYGQNAQKMAKHLDIIIPMVYRYSFGSEPIDKGADWISGTAKWFVDDVKAAGEKCEVWSGVLTYRPLAPSDTQIEWLDAAVLEEDCRLSLQDSTGMPTGATGVVLFRYGIVNYFDMKSL